MEKNNIIILLISIISFVYFTYDFVKTRNVPVTLCKEIVDATSGYYPDAYKFMHDYDYIANLFFPHEHYLAKHSNDSVAMNEYRLKFDRYCRDYSYLIVYGRKVKAINYSMKSSYFDDPSPDYCNAKKRLRKYATIEYYGDTTSSVYIYRLRRDVSLSGIFGY